MGAIPLEEIGKYPPDSVYKDLRPPWLGRIPEHWDVRRLRAVATVTLSGIDKKSSVGEQPVRLCNYVDVYKNDLITDQIDFMKATASKSEISRLALQQGDVLLTKDSETWEDIAVPAYVPATLPGVVCGYHLALIRPNTHLITGRYFFRALSAISVAYQLHIAANGVTRYGLAQSAIKDVLLPIPPLHEQIEISGFLDRKLDEIDGFIESKRRLIELLNEQKTSVITPILTRGTRPDVHTRPSGVEDIDKIPEHWKVRRAKYLFHEINERSRSGRETKLSMSQKYGLVENSRIEDHITQTENNQGLKLCREDDLVLNRLKAHLGVIARASIPGLVSPDYTVFRPNSDVDTRYYERLFKHPAYRACLTKATKGITKGFWRLYTPDFNDIKLLVPPFDEQTEIVSFIEVALQPIELAIAQAEREIVLIKEYRTTLISDVIIGKIDIRGLRSGQEAQ